MAELEIPPSAGALRGLFLVPRYSLGGPKAPLWAGDQSDLSFSVVGQAALYTRNLDVEIVSGGRLGTGQEPHPSYGGQA